MQQVLAKLSAEIDIDLPESTLALSELLEVGVNHFPLRVFLHQKAPEIGKEIAFLLAFIEEAELFIDYRLDTHSLNSLGFQQYIGIILPLDFILWFLEDIDAQVFLVIIFIVSGSRIGG